MRVLVTGAGGRVAGHLLPALQAAGHQVVALSCRTSEALASADRHIAEPLTRDSDFPRLLDRIEAVVHLADGFNAYEHLPAATRHPEAEERLDLTERLVRAVAERGLFLVYLSSVKAMCGTYAEEVLSETSPVQPASLYGRLKLATENAIRENARKTGSSAAIIRFPIVFGAKIGGNMERLLGLAASPWPLPFKGLEARRSLVSSQTLIGAIGDVLARPPAGAQLYLLHDGAMTLEGMMIALRRGLDREPHLFGLSAALWSGLERLPVLGENARRFARPLEVDDSLFRTHYGWPQASGLSQRLTQYAAQAVRSGS